MDKNILLTILDKCKDDNSYEEIRKVDNAATVKKALDLLKKEEHIIQLVEPDINGNPRYLLTSLGRMALRNNKLFINKLQ